MNKEQEIIELGVILNNKELADYLYNAGYRKQSEVAKEIYQELMNNVLADYEERLDEPFVTVKDIKDIFKKYGVEL